MKIGDVVFFYHTSSPISYLISCITKSRFSHVGLYVGDGKIIEADYFIRSRARDFTFDPERHAVYRPMDIDDDERAFIKAHYKEYLGIPYDYFQVVGFFFRLVFGYKKKNLFNRANLLICSELVDRLFNRADVARNSRGRYPVGDVDPQQLFEVYHLNRLTTSEAEKVS